jgi:hypothetical protein
LRPLTHGGTLDSAPTLTPKEPAVPDGPTPEELARTARLCGRILGEQCLKEGVPDFAVEPMINAGLTKARPDWECDDAEAGRLFAEYREGVREALAMSPWELAEGDDD